MLVEFNELYQKYLTKLKTNINFLSDKPEETADSCLNALWIKAMGINKSVETSNFDDLINLNRQQIILLEKLIEERISGVPIAYITNRQNFMGLEFISDNRALIPRKETEILGKKSFEICQVKYEVNPNLRIFDICCGSGNLGLSMAKFLPGILVYSSDLSLEAVALTYDNINFLHLEKQVKVFQGNMFEPFNSEVYYNNIDVIICNPPYISSAKVSKMNSEIVVNEPSIAFDGGMLGTKIIQNLIRESPRFLAKGGNLLFEVGLGQDSLIIKLCSNLNIYSKIEGICDSNGNVRVVNCVMS